MGGSRPSDPGWGAPAPQTSCVGFGGAADTPRMRCFGSYVSDPGPEINGFWGRTPLQKTHGKRWVASPPTFSRGLLGEQGPFRHRISMISGPGNKHKIQRTSGSAQPSCAQAQRKIGRIRHEPAPNLPIFEGRASPGTSLGKRGQGTKTETGLKYSGGINNEAGIFERAPGRPRSCQRIVNFGPLSSQTGSHEPGESAQLGSQLGLDEFSDS